MTARVPSSTILNRGLVVALAVLTISTAGCGSSQSDPTTTTTIPAATATTTPAATATTTAAPAATSTTTTVLVEEEAGSPILYEVDVAYGPDEKHKLDVFYQEGLVDAPTILLLHGGGWRTGTKGGQRGAAEFFAELGFVAAAPNYRLLRSDGENAFPAAANDVGCAAAWLNQHAADFGGDPAIMFVAGYSSGAHLGAVIAYNPERGWQDECPIQGEQLDFKGFIGLAGPYDFAVLSPSPMAKACLLLHDILDLEPGVDCAEVDPAGWAQANPADLAGPGDPPALLVTGDNDCFLSIPDPETGLCTASPDRFAAALKAAGVPVDVLILPGFDHGGPSTGLPPAASAIREFLQQQGIPITQAPVSAVTSGVLSPTTPTPEQALPGVWYTQSFHPLVIGEDGSWSLRADVTGLSWTWGTYTFDGDVLTLTTDDDALCEGNTGIYQVAISQAENQIHFTLVDDTCVARRFELSQGPHERVPDLLVPANMRGTRGSEDNN